MARDGPLCVYIFLFVTCLFLIVAEGSFEGHASSSHYNDAYLGYNLACTATVQTRMEAKTSSS